jgi:hypothetical protein
MSMVFGVKAGSRATGCDVAMLSARWGVGGGQDWEDHRGTRCAECAPVRREARPFAAGCGRLTCGTPTFLKGTTKDVITFSQRLWTSPFPADPTFTVGDRVLAFLARRLNTGEVEVAYWVNLTHPGVQLAQHAAYDNECNYLQDATKILALVKSRIATEQPVKVGRRGLLIQFKPMETADFAWDFVRTADPEYKDVLLTRLRDSKFPDEKAEIIFNLASYPGTETVNLLRTYLRDPGTTKLELRGPEKKTVQYYPVRQAVYLALWILGENAEPPPLYLKDVQPWRFEVGFETTYFPYGNWKRFPE